MVANSMDRPDDRSNQKRVRYRFSDLTKLDQRIQDAVNSEDMSVSRGSLAERVVKSLGKRQLEGAKNYFLDRHILNEIRRRREQKQIENRQPMLPGMECRFVHRESKIRVNGRWRLEYTAPLDEVEAAARTRLQKPSSIARRRAEAELKQVEKARNLGCRTLQEADEKLRNVAASKAAGMQT